MGEHEHAGTNGKGAGRVRARLLTALHVGRLRPGDRVASVRRLADLTGVNHKAVHRAYTALAREGILDVRPGSGTFVADRRTKSDGFPALTALLNALEKCRSDADRLGLTPAELARFLEAGLSNGLCGTTVGLVECNWEQITMIGEDLRSSLGVRVRPILLGTLERDPTQAVGGVGSVVTTDCHRSQVASLLEPHGIATYSVALDQRFPRHLLNLAARDAVVMVLHDGNFGRVFVKLLEQMTNDARALGNIRFIDERCARETLRTARPGTWVYLSPLAHSSMARAIPPHARRIGRKWHVERDALESLRAGLALDRSLAESR
jgi:DNA-binding transcriptional regulator YhcF (GntR family)